MPKCSVVVGVTQTQSLEEEGEEAGLGLGWGDRAAAGREGLCGGGGRRVRTGGRKEESRGV